MLSALRSFTMVRIHDCLGRLGGQLQRLSNPEITAHSAIQWSIRISDLTTCLSSSSPLLPSGHSVPAPQIRPTILALYKFLCMYVCLYVQRAIDVGRTKLYRVVSDC